MQAAPTLTLKERTQRFCRLGLRWLRGERAPVYLGALLGIRLLEFGVLLWPPLIPLSIIAVVAGSLISHHKGDASHLKFEDHNTTLSGADKDLYKMRCLDHQIRAMVTPFKLRRRPVPQKVCKRIGVHINDLSAIFNRLNAGEGKVLTYTHTCRTRKGQKIRQRVAEIRLG